MATQTTGANNDKTSKAIDYPPYTLKSIFAGEFCKENMKDFRETPKTKDLLLPFQDEKTWKLLNNVFDIKQPQITKERKKGQVGEELKYLSKLFQELGKHKANKLCSWLNLIRELGTSGIPSSMDISSQMNDGKKNKLSNKENGEQIYQTFFNQTLPFIKELIKKMPEIFKTKQSNQDEEKKEDKYISLNYQNPMSNSLIEMTRGQIASILACCWFGIPLYEHCSFHGELNSVGTPAKLEMFIRYFEFVRQKGINSNWFKNEKVTIWRRCLNVKECQILEYKNLIKNDNILCDFSVYEEGCIEDEIGELQADFANQYIGGGVLEGGNVQEEIRFTVNTECIISKFLNPLPMRHNEVIIIMGSQQFFNYKGYGSSFSFNGYRNNKKEMFFCDNKRDRLGSSCIIGMDAIYFFNPKNQIKINQMMREIAKSYIGFSIDNDKHIGHKMEIISTGNWGCGIFRGDPQLKAILQWISATLSNRKISYYTFKDPRVAQGKLKKIIQDISNKNITVGQLWNVMINPQFEEKYKQGQSVISYLQNALLL